MTCATALIVDYWDGAARQRAFGLQASAMGFGAALFPLVGGALAEFGWRLAFAAYLLPVPLAILAYLTLTDLPRAPAADRAPPSAFPLRFALVVFALGFLGMVALYAIPLIVPFHLRELGHGSPVLAAAIVGLPGLVAALVALCAGAVQSRMSPPSLVALAFGAMALGYAIAGWSGSFTGLVAGLGVCGIGFGLNTPNLTGWLQSRMPADMRGRAAGGYTTAVFLGQFAATFVFAFLVAVVGLAGAFVAVAAICLLVTVCAAGGETIFGTTAWARKGGRLSIAFAGGVLRRWGMS
jgi:MFS family permease